MGLADRDYARRRPPQMSPLAQARGLSVTAWIIIINVAVHVIALGLFGRVSPFGGGGWSVLHQFGYFSPAEAFFYVHNGTVTLNFQVWRLITFQFLHDPNTIWHIVLNMFGLWIFGRTVEQYLGKRKYLAFYLICGIFGALLYVILNALGSMGLNAPGLLVSDPRTPLIGASAGVFGVIIACAYIAPDAIVRLIFPPIPLKMNYFAYGYVALATYNLLVGGHNAGGDAAHLGGAAAGYYFIRHSHLLTDFFDVFNNSTKGHKTKARKGASHSNVAARRHSQSAVDRVLDKVSQHGLGSLSDKEKKILRDASDHAQH